jgi:uncharacterized protein YukE
MIGDQQPVKVQPLDFHDTGKAFLAVQQQLDGYVTDLVRALGDHAGCGGIDDTARKFAQQYYRAVFTLGRCDGVAERIICDMAAGIDQAGYNHWHADAATVPGVAPNPPWTPVDPPLLLSRDIYTPELTGANGVLPPPFDNLVPLGDPGQIRHLSDAFRGYADRVDNARGDLHVELQSLFCNNSSADVTAMEDFWSRISGQQDIAIFQAVVDGARKIADALVDFAIWIEHAQNAVLDVIGNIVGDILEGIILGIVLGLISDGIGTIGEIINVIRQVGKGGELAVAISGAIATVNTEAAAAGAAVGGTIGLMTAAMNSSPTPNVNPADTTTPASIDDTQVANATTQMADQAGRGTIDESASRFNPDERAIADRLAADGRDVKAIPRGAGRTPDAEVDGRPVEFKTVKTNDANAGTIKNTLDKSARRGGQSPNIIVNAEGTSLSAQQAREGIQRYLGNKGYYESITIWLPDGTAVTWP